MLDASKRRSAGRSGTRSWRAPRRCRSAGSATTPMKFIQREERRGSRYDIILTDPPKFGRGPNGEVWQLFDHLAAMLDICREILSPDARGLVLTGYSIRASFYSIHELNARDHARAWRSVESGELIIREGGLDGTHRAAHSPTSLFKPLGAEMINDRSDNGTARVGQVEEVTSLTNRSSRISGP